MSNSIFSRLFGGKEEKKPDFNPALEQMMTQAASVSAKATKYTPRIIGDYADGANQLSDEDQEASYSTSDLIYSCVDYIATTAGQATIRIGEKDKSGKIVPIKDKKIQELFDYAPNDFNTWGDLIDIAVKSRLLTGNSYITLEKVGSKYEMWCLVPPSKVTVVPDKKKFVNGYMWNDEVAYKTEEVCHWRNKVIVNEYYGQSAVTALIDQLLLEGYGTEDLKQFYENSSIGEGVLSSEFPLTPEQVEKLRQQFRETYSQQGNRHSAVVLPNGMKYDSITINPKDAMILDSLNISEHRVLQTFHLNPLVLGGKLESYTTKTKEVQQMVFNTAVRPLLYGLADALTLFFKRNTGKPYVVYFDFDRIPELSDSMSDKSEYAKTLWSTGIASLNEARDLVGLDRIDHANADKHFLPSYLLGSDVNTIEDLDLANLPDNENMSTPGSTDPQGGNPDLIEEE